MMRVLRNAAFFAICIWVQPALAAPTDFGQGTQIGRVSGMSDLPREMRRVYRSFKKEVRYFGAMAVNYDTAVAIYMQNYHQADRAQAAALEGCRIISLKKEGCTIYAVAMPNSLPIDQFDAQGLSEAAAEDLKAVYRERRIPGTYAAFAISGAGHHGYGTAYLTAEDARDSALAYCERGVAADMAAMGPDARRFARARGWQKCRVIDVAFTPKEK